MAFEGAREEGEGEGGCIFDRTDNRPLARVALYFAQRNI